MAELHERITHYRIYAYGRGVERAAHTVILLHLEGGGTAYAVFSDDPKEPLMHPGPPPRLWFHHPVDRLGPVYEMLKREDPVFVHAGWPDLTAQPTWVAIANAPEVPGDEDMDPPAP